MKLVKVSMLLLAVVVIGVSLGGGGGIVGGVADDFETTDSGVFSDVISNNGVIVTYDNQPQHATKWRDKYDTQINGERINSPKFSGGFDVLPTSNPLVFGYTDADQQITQLGSVPYDTYYGVYTNQNGYITAVYSQNGVIKQTTVDPRGVRNTTTALEYTDTTNLTAIDGDYGIILHNTQNNDKITLSKGTGYNAERNTMPIATDTTPAFGPNEVVYRLKSGDIGVLSSDGSVTTYSISGISNYDMTYDPLTQQYLGYDGSKIYTYTPGTYNINVLYADVPTNLNVINGQYYTIENSTMTYYTPQDMGTRDVTGENYTIPINDKGQIVITIETANNKDTIIQNTTLYSTTETQFKTTDLDYEPIVEYTHDHSEYNVRLTFDSISEPLKNIIDAIPFIMFVAILLGIAISVKD